MDAFVSKGNFESYDDCFYSDNEPIDPDTEFQEFLEKTKENLFRLSQKSESSIKARKDEGPLKCTSLPKQLKPDTNESLDGFEKFVSDIKNSLLSPVKNADNFCDKLSANLLTTADVSTESPCDVVNDDSDLGFSKFISELKNNLHKQVEIIPNPSDGCSNSLEDTSTDDSEGKKSKNRMKNDLRNKSRYECKSSAESSSSSEDTSTDDSEGEDFENFISLMKNNLESKSKYEENSEVPLNLESRNALKKQRSHSLANEGSPNLADSVSKRSQSVSSNTVFNLSDAEAEAEHNFMKKRKVYAAQLYKFFNETVFNNRLPEDMLLKWSGYLKSTAGKTFCLRKSGQYSCHIELSTDVLISFDRLRDTLLHEMCHAACWLVNHSHDKHGPLWKTWASRCNLILPQIEVPLRCHQYELSYSYILKCVSCDFMRKRHKMCPKLNRKNCPKCRSSTVLTKA